MSNKSMFEALKIYLDDPKNLEDMVSHFKNIQDREERNISKIKKMFTNEASFDVLVNKILNKHTESWRDRCYKKGHEPYPWYLLYALFDLAEAEGIESEPLDGLTENFPSSIKTYYNWQFAVTHGQGSVCSVYYDKKLMYRD